MLFRFLIVRALFLIARVLFLLTIIPLFLTANAQTSIQNPGQTASPLGRVIPGRFIVSYRNGVIPSDASARAERLGARLVQRHERLGISILQIGSDSARNAIALDPAVESIVQDRIVIGHSVAVRALSAPAAPADSLYNSPQGWAVRQVGGFGTAATSGPATPGPWDVTTGKGVRIAILDSGIDATHPDLSPNLAFNLSVVDQTPIIGLPSACDDGSPQDQQGHGTWAASLAAGALGPETGLVAGVAPNATLLNIKVLERMPSEITATDPAGCAAGQAAGLLSWVIQGIEAAVAQRADIVSMSLGTLVDITTGDGAGLRATFDRVTHAAAQSGVILIAAAGNDGFDLTNQRYIELPAQARDVLAIVASTNPACAENLISGATCTPGHVTLPYYSNFGAPLNALAAPGGSYPASPADDNTAASGWIQGACSSGKPSTASGLPADSTKSFGCFGLGHTAYVQAMGTSASAPLAAGAAALLRAANPTWDAATVVAALRASAVTTAGLSVAQINVAHVIVPTRIVPVTKHILNDPQQ